MMKYIFAAVISFLLLPIGASAQEVGSYRNAVSPLTGTERILGDQSSSYPCVGCTVNLTPLQISNYAAAQAGNYALLFDNAGIMSGIIPVATGQYCLNWSSLTAAPTLVTCSSASTAFSALTSGSNTTATMTVGTGGSLAYTGSGVLNANEIAGLTWPSLVSSNCLTNNGTALSWGTCGSGSGTVNSGTAGDIAYYAATGTAVSQLALGSAFTTTGGTLQPIYSINAQTGTTYTIATTDFSKLITFSNASAVAVTLPQGTGTFAGASFDVENLGAGTVTITPTTSTINGAATLAITTNQGCSITSDGTNYQVSACTAVAPGGSSAFSSLTSGTNTAAAMLVGTGSSLGATGTGTITATSTTEPINAQTGTTYTVATTDTGKLITINNAAAIAVTLPVATTSGFGAGFHFRVQDLGAGTATITPTTSTINGSATLVIPKNVGCSVNSDGTNYQVSACTSLGANAIYVNGVSVPASASVVATNSSSQLVAATTVSYPLDYGTQYTVAGTGACATITKTGTTGTAAGKFQCTGTVGASTITITLPAATNGWSCEAHDVTTIADTLAEGVGTTTTDTFSSTATAANDYIKFSCTGF